MVGSGGVTMAWIILIFGLTWLIAAALITALGASYKRGTRRHEDDGG